MEIKELTTITEMLAELRTMQHLYPNLSPARYQQMLSEMLPHNYRQIAVFDQGQCVGISGFWLGTKLWSGKFMELDNFIVDPDHRSKGIGKMICDYAEALAVSLGCTNIVLDAYTNNFAAHRFYYNQGFGPKGFHFVKILDLDGLT
ncbi:MAG TPA: GNAT family N-acetyltransferase [Flavobacterium sp.]|jgi:ribosomal protein S18 acetylase RimI-like enzyme